MRKGNLSFGLLLKIPHHGLHLLPDLTRTLFHIWFTCFGPTICASKLIPTEPILCCGGSFYHSYLEFSLVIRIIQTFVYHASQTPRDTGELSHLEGLLSTLFTPMGAGWRRSCHSIATPCLKMHSSWPPEHFSTNPLPPHMGQCPQNQSSYTPFASPATLFRRWRYLSPADLYFPSQASTKLRQKYCHFNTLRYYRGRDDFCPVHMKSNSLRGTKISYPKWKHVIMIEKSLSWMSPL